MRTSIILDYLSMVLFFILIINTFFGFYKQSKLKKTFNRLVKMDLSDYMAAESEKRGFRAYMFAWNSDYDGIEEIRKAKRELRFIFKRQIYLMILMAIIIAINVFISIILVKDV